MFVGNVRIIFPYASWNVFELILLSDVLKKKYGVAAKSAIFRTRRPVSIRMFYGSRQNAVRCGSVGLVPTNAALWWLNQARKLLV